ncbi:MAG: hypothetical protein ACFFBP_21050 [Promethearchaeota archaeon]
MDEIIITPENFISGLNALLISIVGLVIGILIMLKYRKYKSKLFLFWGFAWCGFYQPWWGTTTSFIYALITRYTIPDQLYMFLSTFFIPFFMIAWIYGLTEMILKDKRKILAIIYSIIMISYNIFLIVGLIFNPTLIGKSEGFNTDYELIPTAYLLFINFSIVISGFLFARDSRKSSNKETRLKSLFLIFAFFTYLTGSIGDVLVSDNVILQAIVRTYIMIGSISFYIGMFMPKFVKKLLKIEEN